MQVTPLAPLEQRSVTVFHPSEEGWPKPFQRVIKAHWSDPLHAQGSETQARGKGADEGHCHWLFAHPKLNGEPIETVSVNTAFCWFMVTGLQELRGDPNCRYSPHVKLRIEEAALIVALGHEAPLLLPHEMEVSPDPRRKSVLKHA